MRRPGGPVARDSSDISVGRFETFVRRLFSLKGGGLLTSVGTDVRPVVNLTGLMLFEERLYKDIRSYAFTDRRAAGGAGTANQWRLNNPQNSGLIIVVEQILFNTGTAGNIILGLDNVTAGAQQQVALLDTRVLGGPGQTPLVTSGAIVAWQVAAVPVALAQFDQGRLATAKNWPNTELSGNGALVLAPGYGIVVWNDALNSADAITLAWYERAADKAELAR